MGHAPNVNCKIFGQVKYSPLLVWGMDVFMLGDFELSVEMTP